MCTPPLVEFRCTERPRRDEMDEADKIVAVIEKNTEALNRVGEAVETVGMLYESTLRDQANWPRCVEEIVAAIRGEPKPK